MPRYVSIDSEGRHLLVDGRGGVLYDYSRSPDEQSGFSPRAHFVAGKSRFCVRDVLTQVSPGLQIVLRDLLVPPEGGSRIIVSYERPREDDSEPGGRVVGGDAWALAHLAHMAGRLREDFGRHDLALQFDYTREAEEETPWRDCNLYLIGGPKWNDASRELLHALGDQPSGQRPRYGFRDYAIMDLEENKTILPDAQFFDEKQRQFPRRGGAILARLPNLLASGGRNRVAWLFAGCRSWGTLAALDALTSSDFTSALANLAAAHQYFQVVLEPTWNRQVPPSHPWPHEVLVKAQWWPVARAQSRTLEPDSSP